ncbi:structural maintenance of chromosomes protein 5 [Bombina bombina]|uniref:structural maintenance of chromosomes protein 5 n=1 Tax=Bombina bombina TaxID=8345 RepID=UPI00235AD41A|nr:structural maintenance of chromosomes protein 5 [Bombina bombina]
MDKWLSCNTSECKRKNQGYKPIAITYHAASHFVCFHRLQHASWIFYDGFGEMNSPGKGQIIATPEVIEQEITLPHSVGHIVFIRLNEAPSVIVKDNKLLCDTIAANKWLDENMQNLFGQVQKPMILSMDAKETDDTIYKHEEYVNSKYETGVNHLEPFVFTFSNSADMDMFLSEKRDKQKLLVHVSCESQL